MELPDAPHRATPAELKARFALEREGEPFLVLRDAEGRQLLRTLGRAERLAIGRDPASDLALDWDAEVSRLHALLERVSDEWNVLDDGRSRNGTFVNGERVHGRRRLRDGDALRVGRTVVVFRDPRGRESMRTLPSEDAVVPELTEAQRRVLVEVCRPFGHGPFAAPASTQEIAERLVISGDTVKTHLTALFAAFGVERLPQNRKRAELARRALETGTIGTPDLQP